MTSKAGACSLVYHLISNLYLCAKLKMFRQYPWTPIILSKAPCLVIWVVRVTGSRNFYVQCRRFLDILTRFFSSDCSHCPVSTFHKQEAVSTNFQRQPLTKKTENLSCDELFCLFSLPSGTHAPSGAPLLLPFFSSPLL